MKYTKITKDLLINEGWIITKNIHFDEEAFHLKIDNYPFSLEMCLKDYPHDNPNCGVFSIHSPQEEVFSVPKDLISKNNWTEEDKKRAENHTITLKAWTQPIAWYVFSMERLDALVMAITIEKY